MVRSVTRQKLFTSLVGLVTIGLLVILASGLGSVDFSSGTPFSVAEENPAEDAPAVYRVPPMIGAIFFLMLVLFAGVVIGFFLATPQQRRTMLAIAAIGLSLLAWLIFSTNQANQVAVLATPGAPGELAEAAPEAASSGMEPSAPAQVFEQPEIPWWVPFGVSFVFVLFFFFLAWMIFCLRGRERTDLGALAEIAEQASEEIRSGKDWGDAIVDCYDRMLKAVGEMRRVNQRDNLTPAEFVSVMVKARLPAAPAERLTSLFERVRYGGKKATQAEIDDALACLDEIVVACREAA